MTKDSVSLLSRRRMEKLEKYKCQGCGRIWTSSDVVVVCPVCRSKGIKLEGEK